MEDPITHIVHFADIHLRAGNIVQSRKAEYLHVFKHLEAKLDSLERGRILAVVCGDIFHHKHRLEGATVQLWVRFIRMITDRMPMVIISGNHDFRQEHPDDPDLLDAMAQTLPALKNACHYLNETKVYEIEGLQFGVVAIRETLKLYDTSGLVAELPEFPAPSDDMPSIALFHGTITQSSLPNGQRLTAGKGYPLEWFQGYDMVLLGDNHLQQWHSAKGDMPAWGYPGSLVQQDFGEPVYGHGFLMWEVATGIAQPFHIANEYSRIRAKLVGDDVWVKLASDFIPLSSATNMPKKPIVSVVGNTGDDMIVMKKLTDHGLRPSQMSTVLNIQQTSYDPVVDVQDLAVIHTPDKWIEYLQTTDPTVIKWFQSPETIIDEPLQDIAVDLKVTERRERIQAAIQDYRNIQERIVQPNHVNLLYMEWAWAFAYGEHNWFNFQTLQHDIAVLNGKNASGKSSFIDIMCIALFGEPGKNRNLGRRMSSTIIHHQKPARVPMQCSVAFQIGSDRYVLERVYTTHKTKADPYGLQLSKCELYKTNEDWNCSLVCSGSTLVDKWVFEHMGSVDDMMESTVVSQMDINNFFMLKPNEQKERIDQSLNMESIQAFGQVLQQATLAYNSWIDSLGIHIQSQRALIGDTVEESVVEDIQELQGKAAKLEMLCNKWVAICGDPSNPPVVTKDALDMTRSVPDDLVELRGQLRKEMQSIETAIGTHTIISVEDAAAKLDILKSVMNTTCEEEFLEWQNCKFWQYNPKHELTDGDGSDWEDSVDKYQAAEKAYQSLLDAYNVNKISIVQSKPIREEKGFAAWKSQLDEWEILLEKASSGEDAEDALGKYSAYLKKWDDLGRLIENLKTSISRLEVSMRELQLSWEDDLGALTEREERCKSSGYDSLEHVQYVMKIKQELDQLESDKDWDIWQKHMQEKKQNQWSLSYCKEQLKIAQRLAYLKVSMPVAQAEIDQLHMLPFNPECNACCTHPTHMRRAELEATLADAKRELDTIAAACRGGDIDTWQHAVDVCSYIRKNKDAMTLHKMRVNECRELVAGKLDNIDMWLTEWSCLETYRSDTDKRRMVFEEKKQRLEAELVESTTQLKSLKKKQKALGSRDDLVNSMDMWKEISDAQYAVEKRKDWMNAEIDAWKKAQAQWAPWEDLFQQQERLGNEMSDARKFMEQLAERANESWQLAGCRLHKERLASKAHMSDQEVCELCIQYGGLKKEWDDVMKLQSIAWYKYHEDRQELSTVQDQLRKVEVQTKKLEWQQQHIGQLTTYETLIEQWRIKRDLLQCAFQRLIGGKEDTYKEWVYETYVIPLLEKHINSFLSTVTVSPLKVEIEYHSKALRFVVFDRGNRTTFGLSSGFQKFIIGLALRLALTRLGGRGHRFKTLIIDEGFVACDTDNVQCVKDILQHMMEVGGFNNILLATHLDTIKDMIPRKIPIQRDGGFSRLQVGERIRRTVGECGGGGNSTTTATPTRGRPKKT